MAFEVDADGELMCLVEVCNSFVELDEAIVVLRGFGEEGEFFSELKGFLTITIFSISVESRVKFKVFHLLVGIRTD